MSELSARAKSLLDDARKQATPSPEELRQVRARLSASLATAAESPSIAAVPFAFLKFAGLAGILAAAALAAWQMGMRNQAPPPGPGSVQRQAPANSRASVPVDVPAAVVQNCPPAPECPAAPAPVCPPRVACTSAPLGSKNGAEASSRREPRKDENLYLSVPTDSKDRWSLEIGLLIDARVALDEQRPIEAMGHIQHHQKLFPKTVFLEERLAIEVVASCLLDQAARARPVFEELISVAPESSYLPRIKQTCGVKLEPAPVENDDE